MTIQEPRLTTLFTTNSPQKTIHFHPLFPKTPLKNDNKPSQYFFVFRAAN
jgi:hypothetical protein